jgi:phage terminase small subunit
MNDERHPENYAAFYGLLNRLPSSDKEALKESIVLQYTDNRTCSLREMTLKEYNAACAGMQKLVPPTFQEQLLKVRKKKRSEVLHQMQLLGINTADWNSVNAFCKDSRIAGKEFRDLDCEELDSLQVRIRTIRRKKEKQNANL